MPTKAELIERVAELTKKNEDLDKRNEDLETQLKSPPPSNGKSIKKKDATKRKPSKYALFVKSNFAPVKEKNPNDDASMIMKKIAIIWKEQKDN